MEKTGSISVYKVHYYNNELTTSTKIHDVFHNLKVICRGVFAYNLLKQNANRLLDLTESLIHDVNTGTCSLIFTLDVIFG